MITVGDLGTQNPHCVDVNEPITVAAYTMKKHRVHQLPVVANDRLVGMISARDLMGTDKDRKSRGSDRANDKDRPLCVGDVCSRSVVSAPHITTIFRGAWLMVRHKVRSLPLTYDGRVVAILTDVDLLRAGLDGVPGVKGHDPTLEWRNTPVADYMTNDPVTADSTASVLDAWMLMQEADIRHLPVVDPNGIVTGIVSDDEVYFALREDSARIPGGQRAQVNLTEIMTNDIEVIGKYDTLEQAARLMLRHRMASLLVADLSLEGLITRHDLLRAMITMGPSN